VSLAWHQFLQRRNRQMHCAYPIGSKCGKRQRVRHASLPLVVYKVLGTPLHETMLSLNYRNHLVLTSTANVPIDKLIFTLGLCVCV